MIQSRSSFIAIVIASNLFHIYAEGEEESVPQKGRIFIPGDGVLRGNFNTKEVSTEDRSVLMIGPYRVMSDRFSNLGTNNKLILSGDVVLMRGMSQMKTNFLEYDPISKHGKMGEIRGTVSRARTPTMLMELQSKEHKERHAKEYYFSAKEAIIRPNEFGEPSIVLISPSFSDCDRVPPHHDIRATSAEFSKEEKIQMWNIHPRMFRIPYFYFPYAVKDLQYDWPWTKWEFGSQADWGRYIKIKTLAIPKPFRRRADVRKVAKENRREYSDGLPDSLKNNLIAGLDYRERRGFAYKLDWENETAERTSRLSTHFYDETWESISGLGSEIQQNRVRADLYHRERLNDSLQFTAEGHYLTPTEKFMWSDGATRTVTGSKYSSPFAPGVGFQERESLLQDYYEEEFRHGRVLENSLALDYSQGRTFMTLSTQRTVDEELPVTVIKDLELFGRNLPTSIMGSDFLYSNEFGLGRMGLHVGSELNDADRQTLFGKTDADDYKHMRFNLEHRIERTFDMGSYLTVTPYIGERSTYYETVLQEQKAGAAFTSIDRETDLEPWFGNHRFKTGAIFSNVVTGYFNWGASEVKHQVRPSISLDYISPSSFDKTRIPVRIDGIDTSFENRLRTVYRLDNRLDMRRSNGRILNLYNSTLQYTSFFKDDDEVQNFGTDLRGNTDLEFVQSVYPIENLRFSLDLRANTFHGQVPTIRKGLFFTNRYIEMGYDYVYIKDIRNAPENPLRRHDLNFGYMRPKFDIHLRASWEEALDQTTSPTSFSKQGFRRLDLRFGRMFHRLRGEIEMNYDWQSSGTSIVFRFGPQLLGESKPNYRYPL